MKRRKLLFAAVGLSACVLYSSCIGSFGLFNKFAEINTSLTKSKFVNGILGFIFIPVYGVCLAADWVVLNTIEFWTGSPLLASVGETRHVVGGNGHSYVIVTEKDGYRIQDETSGEETLMVFNEEEQTWNLAQEGGMLKLMEPKSLQTKSWVYFLRRGEVCESVVSDFNAAVDSGKRVGRKHERA